MYGKNWQNALDRKGAQAPWAVLLILGLAALSWAGCGPSKSDPYTARVTRQEYGDRWPLTVDSGTLHNDEGAVLFESDTDRKIYALNGTAKTRNLGMDISPIWANADKGAAGPKKSLGPLIDRGLTLPP